MWDNTLIKSSPVIAMLRLTSGSCEQNDLLRHHTKFIYPGLSRSDNVLSFHRFVRNVLIRLERVHCLLMLLYFVCYCTRASFVYQVFRYRPHLY